MEYHEVLILVPDELILNEYRKTGDWTKYEQRYLELIRNRNAEKYITPILLEEGIVLLCSEAQPTHCHRRLAAEYLVKTLPNEFGMKIVHL